jgi:cyclic beta-1,2-glucan synthetase
MLPSAENPPSAASLPPSSSSSSPELKEENESRMQNLCVRGIHDAEGWRIVERDKSSPKLLITRWQNTVRRIRAVSRALGERQAKGETLTLDEVWLVDNVRLLRTLAEEVNSTLTSVPGPRVQDGGAEDKSSIVPRTLALSAAFVQAVDLEPTEKTLSHYCEGVQQVDSLMMAEIWALKPMLEFAIFERLADLAERHCSVSGEPLSTIATVDSAAGQIKKAIQALRAVHDIDWKDFFDRNNAPELALREDPCCTYDSMDDESRQMYLRRVADLSRQSRCSEREVAREAILLAMRAKSRSKNPDSRITARRSHVGYYLIDEGSRALAEHIGYQPTLKQRILDAILEWPEVFFVVGVESTTIALVFFLLYHLGIIVPLFPGFLLLIPASHAAIGIVNTLTGMIVPPRRIPKLDYSEGIPATDTTLVAVPCLLLSESEVRRNVDSLEIRYLGNNDPNLHFALLTDSPDAAQPFDEHDELVGLCSGLIERLNRKYAQDGRGSFLHLHRHRAYNASEERWMGWERKRGKLIDLNNLLLGTFDSFPVKTGDRSILRHIRYVLTLDADTKLPPGTARRLVGALAHPLNRAVVDPKTNTVIEGYGILQPRVSISIESSRHSRLASIFSGQTGFDIYTQAASDVYQDLFGEGSFTGKGIYEVEAFQKVLGKRFPTNALLSHDLIEGSYARAGLVSDIVVIDDYPSHFSAYCRRLHRWVRGDWQIMMWLFPKVPDYYGRRVANPLTFISRWKIFDNLRRSLNDIGLFLLLILGWAVLPGGPVYWTLVTLGLLLMPTYSQLAFALLRVRRGQNWAGFLRERVNDLVSGHLQVFVMLVFLPHQAVVMLDAITRTLVRVIVTHSNMLEWETAAESELGEKKSLVETYLSLTPCISLSIGLLLAVVRPSALYIASPILALWLLPDFSTDWVNRRPAERKLQVDSGSEAFLRLAGLRTWRYFREFSTAENRWLIPDNVQENPQIIAARLSSTNLGLLLNADLAAHELGYSTLEEYTETVERTLRSAEQLPRHKGHFFNWYDLQTFRPLEPLFVSTVDSGNLAACLWTLKHSCLGLTGEPLLPQKLWQGIRDHIKLVAHYDLQSSTPTEGSRAVRELEAFTEPLKDDASAWIGALPWLQEQCQRLESSLIGEASNSAEAGASTGADLAWWVAETAARLNGVRSQVENLLPWGLPEFSPLFHKAPLIEGITLESHPAALRTIEQQVVDCLSSSQASGPEKCAARLLQRRLPQSAKNAAMLSDSLERLARDTDRLVNEMDFSFLYNPKKKLFSTGFNVSANTLDSYYYDLLASEARTAVFIAAAQGQVHQESWFGLGRSYAAYAGQRVLLSWSGTMFEYMMPALWLRSLPDTMMDQTLHAAVFCQREYARRHGIPWGISETALSERDPQGIYHYRAIGVPDLALDPHAPHNLVVSPYSSFLASICDPEGATQNLHRMETMGCMGSRGFYESCDFTPVDKTESFEIVRCWMAHHQGMSLVALSNLLNDFSNQKWFHREPKVRAAEMFLHEKVPLSVPVKSDAAGSAEKERPASTRVRTIAPQSDNPDAQPGPQAHPNAELPRSNAASASPERL